MTLVPMVGSVQVAASVQAFRPHALIPLYDGGNATEWSQTCSHVNGSGGGSWIIADVAEGAGAGSAPVASWARVIDNCYRYNKASVIGYVWTNYGQNGLASVEAGIDNWYRFYPGDIAGLFLDGVSDTIPGTTTSNASYYQTLDTYIHTRHRNNGEVVLNFGYNPRSDWMFTSSANKNADIVVTFEGSYDTPGMNPYTAWVQAAWEVGYPAHDFAVIVYDAPNTVTTPQPSTACAGMARQNVGYVYVGMWYDEMPYLSGDC
ncbi:MAG: spherulation-specific family 4 protein [Acidimicrobiia bacterium]